MWSILAPFLTHIIFTQSKIELRARVFLYNSRRKPFYFSNLANSNFGFSCFFSLLMLVWKRCHLVCFIILHRFNLWNAMLIYLRLTTQHVNKHLFQWSLDLHFKMVHNDGTYQNHIADNNRTKNLDQKRNDYNKYHHWYSHWINYINNNPTQNKHKNWSPNCMCSVFCIYGHWSCVIQQHCFYCVEIMNADIWQNISHSSKNVSVTSVNWEFSHFFHLCFHLFPRPKTQTLSYAVDTINNLNDEYLKKCKVIIETRNSNKANAANENDMYNDQFVWISQQ